VKELSKFKILIVEDNAIAALDIKFQLQLEGYDVPDVFSSGEKLLKSLNKVKADLVLMDINLKGKINGITTAKIIKEKFNIPIIFLTAYSPEKMKNQVEFNEYDGYLKKPLDNFELLKAVENVLDGSVEKIKVIDHHKIKEKYS
jgi:two-component system, response regulator PdtaR